MMYNLIRAEVVKLVDTRALEARASNGMEVRVLSSAPEVTLSELRATNFF